MRIKKYKYLIRLIVSILLALTVAIVTVFSFLWTHAFEEIRKGNEVYYDKLADSFLRDFTMEIDSLRKHAAALSVDSRYEESAFWLGVENYRKNAYWYLEAVSEMKNKYAAHNAGDCGIYYYETDSVITKGSKQTLDQFLKNSLQVTGEREEALRAYFSQENYQFLKLVFGTTNTQEDIGGKFLVGYCTVLGKNRDSVMIFYQIAPDDLGDMLNLSYGAEGVWLYVTEQGGDQIYLAGNPTGSAVENVFPLEARERNVSGTRQKVLYQKDSASLPLSFAVYLTDESLQNNIVAFYHDMKKLIFIMIFLVIGICVVALYAEYKPMYRILAQLEEDEADEFTMIQSALNNRRAIIQEQELLITDLLIKHLIYGVPVGRERLNKLGVKVSGGFYCAYVLVGHILLTGEVEEMTEELEERFQVRLFVIEIQEENSNVLIAFLKSAETKDTEQWLQDWVHGRLGEDCKLYPGKVVDQLDEIRSSFLHCYEKRNEYEAAQKAMKADQEALERKEVRQKKLNEEILAYLELHYRDVDLSQTQVADAFRISSYTLSRMFKTQIGVGFTEYVNFKRLEYAKELLLTTGYSVHEIAFLAGYANDNYFSRIFKANVGMSPTAFREK